jgi:phosphatidylserine/phosphatidylglycerophosphate/cardiolipin synthase-like enzyme
MHWEPQAVPVIAGVVVGQAARFDEYKLEDGTVINFARQAALGALPESVSDEELTAAEEAVAEQAAHVRQLKDAEGLSNSDSAVQVRGHAENFREHPAGRSVVRRRQLFYAMQSTMHAQMLSIVGWGHLSHRNVVHACVL